MKFLLLLCVFLATNGAAQNKIVVQVTGFQNNKGVCLVCLYDNAKAFAGKGAPLHCEAVSIHNQTASVVFEQVADGTYAVSVIHDANNNKKFDTNFLGIPKEGYGASNNKLPFAAAPKFDENKFTVIANATVKSTIKLRYIF